MEGSVVLIRQTHLKRFEGQIKRNISLRGKKVPFEGYTPNGNRYQARDFFQIVGKPDEALRKVKKLAIEIDTLRKTRNLDESPRISIRRQFGRFKGNRGEERLPFNLTLNGYRIRLKDILGQSLSVIEALSAKLNALRSGKTGKEDRTSISALEKLAVSVRTHRSPLLADLGKIGEIVVDRRRKVLVGLETSKLIEQLKMRRIDLKQVLDRNVDFLTNDRGMLSNLFREEVENLVPKISKIFNLKIGLPDEKTSEVIAEELAGELLANLIFWYYNQTGVTIVRNMIIKDIDPVAHPYFGGLVLIEA